MLNDLHSRERSTMVKMVKMDKIQVSRDHHVTDHFRKSPYFSVIKDTTRDTIQKPFVDTCSKFRETSGRNFSVEKTDPMNPETDNIACKINCNQYFVLIF